MEHSPLLKSFKGSATYQIIVKGKVDNEFISNFSDLTVSHTKSRGKILSALTGEIIDQAALSGLINILVDYRFEVISVMKISD